MTGLGLSGVKTVTSSEQCQAHNKCLQTSRCYLFQKHIVLAQGNLAKLMGRSMEKELGLKVSRCLVASRQLKQGELLSLWLLLVSRK